MKILQTIPTLLASWGGPSTCTCDLLDGLYDINADVDLLTTDTPNDKDILLGKGRKWMHTVDFDWKTPLALSDNFKQALTSSDYDLYHTNTIWLYPCHATCSIARKKGKPYILSTHGMLYPTALKVNKWKKWPMLKLWFNNDITKANCLHATCEQEMNHIRDFGYKGPIAIIPNPVVFPENVELAKNKSFGRKRIGFLGRLHPIKKVENILYALSLLSREEQDGLLLEIMGKYDDRYETFLKTEVERLKLNDCVEFVGFVSGRDKYARLANLWALMVPSEQENFGMIVPEALICGTPVYASLGTPWNELNEFSCGWWKDNEPQTIATIMRYILNIEEKNILEMGKRGRNLIEEKYEQHKVAKMMVELYKWILGQAEKPEFVYI